MAFSARRVNNRDVAAEVEPLPREVFINPLAQPGASGSTYDRAAAEYGEA